MRAHELVVSGWRGGDTWGLRVPSEHRRCFEKHQIRLRSHDLVVYLPGVRQPIRIRLSPSFWRECPEVRSVEIGRWMCCRGEAPWRKQRPPKYRASLIIGQEVELWLRGSAFYR